MPKIRAMAASSPDPGPANATAKRCYGTRFALDILHPTMLFGMFDDIVINICASCQHLSAMAAAPCPRRNSAAFSADMLPICCRHVADMYIHIRLIPACQLSREAPPIPRPSKSRRPCPQGFPSARIKEAAQPPCLHHPIRKASTIAESCMAQTPSVPSPQTWPKATPKTDNGRRRS